jgi:CheY-like chemotaxis protein/anti-sigma regulatory factor (Ser/Thr protein kinase)
MAALVRADFAMAKILLIDPDPAMLFALDQLLALRGHALDVAAGSVDALRQLRVREVDVLVTSPATHVEEDLALIDEARRLRPELRAVVLASRAAQESVVAALRARVFALFTTPFDVEEIAEMIHRASESTPARDGIEVRSAHPDWVSVRLDCSLVTAERILQFVEELRTEVPAADREGLILAYREVLLNAMQHGAGSDSHEPVEVAAVRTERSIVFYVRGPGEGFDVVSTIARAERQAPTWSQGLEGESPQGFGVLLAQMIVNEVIYSEHGNEVVLIKHTP